MQDCLLEIHITTTDLFNEAVKLCIREGKKLEPTSGTDTSVTNYRRTSRNIPQQLRHEEHSNGRRKSCRWRDISQSIVRDCT